MTRPKPSRTDRALGAAGKQTDVRETEVTQDLGTRRQSRRTRADRGAFAAVGFPELLDALFEGGAGHASVEADQHRRLCLITQAG